MVESAGCEGACSTLSHDGKVSLSNARLSNPRDQDYDSDDESDAECLQILVELEEMLGLERILEPSTETPEDQDALNVELDKDLADPSLDFDLGRDVSAPLQSYTLPELSGSASCDKYYNSYIKHYEDGKPCVLNENLTEVGMKVLSQTPDVALPISTSKTPSDSGVVVLDLNENIFTSSFSPEVAENIAASHNVLPSGLSSSYTAECAFKLKSINSHDTGSEPELEHSHLPPIVKGDLEKVASLKPCYVDLCRDNILLTSQKPGSKLVFSNSPPLGQHLFSENQDSTAVESESTQLDTPGTTSTVESESTQSDTSGIISAVESESTRSDTSGIISAVESESAQSDTSGIISAVESESTQSDTTGITCAVESESTKSDTSRIISFVESECTQSDTTVTTCAVESEFTESDISGITCAVESESTESDTSGITSTVQILSSVASEEPASWKVDSNKNLVHQIKPLVELSGKALPSKEASTAGPTTELSQNALLIKEVSSSIPTGSCALPLREKSSSSEDVFVFTGGPSTSSGSRQQRIAAVNIPAQLSQSKPRSSVPWISSDAAENEDNNDPKWELMRKLRTDEERYRILRKRWRNLTIPDPKRDLTVQSFRKRQMYLKKKSEQQTVGDSNNNITLTAVEPQSRKRARSPDGSLCDEPPHKRRARWSCTHVLDQRVATMKHNMDMKFKELHTEYRAALFNLSVQQKREKENLLFHLRARHPASVEAAIGDQYFRHVEEVDMLKHQYEERLQNYEDSRHKLINLLKSASHEINAFHKFYHQLNHSNDDQMWITDEEVDELAEAERMYELFDTLYQS